jgi:hypothetical protein
MSRPAKVGERLPYLLSAMKAPRIGERLEATAERAREEKWPYEQFLETLLEARVSELLCVRSGPLVDGGQSGSRSPKWILRPRSALVQL